MKQFGDTKFPQIFNCFNHINIAANVSWLLPPHRRTCAWCITSKDPGHQNQRRYSYLTSCSALCSLQWKTKIQKLLLEQVNILHGSSHIDFSVIPQKQEWYTSVYSTHQYLQQEGALESKSYTKIQRILVTLALNCFPVPAIAKKCVPVCRNIAKISFHNLLQVSTRETWEGSDWNINLADYFGRLSNPRKTEILSCHVISSSTAFPYAHSWYLSQPHNRWWCTFFELVYFLT